jgi:hypothetical protein
MNFDHVADRKLITGKAGSGKTTYFLAVLKKSRARWIFCFDPEREIARKTGWPTCVDVPGLNAAVAARRPACFDCTPLFPGDRPEGFAFFCRYVLCVSRALHGTKLLAVDELQAVQTTGTAGLPQSFSELLDEGRRQEIDCLFISQSVNRVHDRVRVQLSEIVTFCHTDRLPLTWLEQDGFDPAAVTALRYPGGHLRRNLHTGETNAHTDPAGKADRFAPPKIRVPESHRRPAQARRADGRFSPVQSPTEAPGRLPG